MKNGKDFKNYATKHLKVNSATLDSYVKSMTPYIMEERQLNVSQVDVFSRLMMDRIIFLGEGIDDRVANIITAQLLYLESCENKEIKLYINSPGGSVYAGLGIYDTMQIVKSPVHTICMGLAASMGAVLLTAGEPGHRYALTHSRVMIHQPSQSGDRGSQMASDMDINLKEINKLKKELYEIISEHSNTPFKKVEKDGDRDYWLTSTEAKEYGLIDAIYQRRNIGKSK